MKNHFFNSCDETNCQKVLISTAEWRSSEELLRISDKCAFSEHINKLGTKVKQKISALAIVSKYLSQVKRKVPLFSYISM